MSDNRISRPLERNSDFWKGFLAGMVYGVLLVLVTVFINFLDSYG